MDEKRVVIFPSIITYGLPNLSKLIVMFHTKFQDRPGLTILPTLYFVFDKHDEQQYYVETKGTSVLGNF